VPSWMIHQLKAIIPILGFPGSCAIYGRFSYAAAHNTANDSPHRAPELPPNASAAVAVVVAIWCNRPNNVLRGSSSRSGTAGLRISVWRSSGSSATANNNRCEPPCLKVLKTPLGRLLPYCMVLPYGAADHSRRGSLSLPSEIIINPRLVPKRRLVSGGLSLG
jgi:hypothetical protein